MAILKKLRQKTYRTLIALSGGFRVKHSASPADAQALETLEAHSFLNLQEYCEKNSLDYSSLKMLKDLQIMTTEILLEPSSPRLMSWGMIANGKCLTAKITEYPRTASGLSLSEILEADPDPKYFLSEAMVRGMTRRLGKRGRQAFVLQQGVGKDTTQPLKRISLTQLQLDKAHLAAHSEEITKTS